MLSLRLDPEADVARVGGEEFAVLSVCDSVEHAAQLAVQLERSLCESGSSVTFGWSAYPREGENALTLYRAADERLYARRVLRAPRVSVAPPSPSSSDRAHRPVRRAALDAPVQARDRA